MNNFVKKNMSKNNLELHWWRGLPGCGKSTEARELNSGHPGKFKTVTKDDLRDLLDYGEWSKENEKFVLKIQDMIIEEALESGFSVLVPDTNLAVKHKTRFEEIAKIYGAKVVFHDLTHVTPEECIKRDLKRARSVGSEVIMKMYRDFLEPADEIYRMYPELPNCLIVDIDGTVAKMTSGRRPYDWGRVGEDSPNEPVINMVKSFLMSNNVKLIFMSGRDEVCRKETEEWLRKYFRDWDALYMRPQGSNEKDTIIKERLFMNWINGRYNCVGIFDDRASVIKMWRKKGLQVYQVAEGDF